MINDSITDKFFNGGESMRNIDAELLDIFIGGFEVIGIEKVLVENSNIDGEEREGESIFIYLRNKNKEEIALQFNSYQGEAGSKIDIVVCTPDCDEADLDFCE